MIATGRKITLPICLLLPTELSHPKSTNLVLAGRSLAGFLFIAMVSIP